MDLIKCRAECWKYSSAPFSLFCCLDSIKKRETQELADWQWIDAGPCDSKTKVLQKMPYCSKGWYYRAATAYLLDKGRITWDDIKFVFNSTAHLPSDSFASAITTVQDAWKSLPGCCREGQPDLNKHGLNSAVGVMRRKDAAEDWHCYSSRNEEDISKYTKVAIPHDNGVCTDWYEATPILSNDSYCAIREQILQEEHLRGGDPRKQN